MIIKVVILINEVVLQIIGYLAENPDTVLTSLREHLVISILSLLIAGVIGILAGLLCIRNRRWERWIVALFQVLRIIPSLAVLILLIPVLGTGIRPAMTALVLLAIPPILMNTVTGFEEVPEFMAETAAGLGMTDRQRFWRVSVPMALPMILTGIKTAMIEIIASAAVAAKIGAGGLGGLILTGIGLNRMDLLLIGGISVAALSILAGVLLDLLERVLMRYKYVKS